MTRTLFHVVAGMVTALTACSAGQVMMADAPPTAIRPESRVAVALLRPVARTIDVPAAVPAAAGVERRKSTLGRSATQLEATETRIAREAAMPGTDVAAVLVGAVRGVQAPLVPDPAARPDIRLVSRPAMRLALGAPPARPVIRPDQPPRLIRFEDGTEPRVHQAAAAIATPGVSAEAVARAVRPPKRSARVTRAAAAAQAARVRGAVCGDLQIQGRDIGTVSGPGSCGIEGAVEVRSIGGVRLSRPARMDCRTATALHRWIRDGAAPAIGNDGGGIATIRVIGGYSCRTRNNASGARLSEHAFGRAIDIAGFALRDGTRISLTDDWNSSAYGARLRQMHRAACGAFGTVLGPDANAAHRDHFHFDTARYRGGSYCR